MAMLGQARLRLIFGWSALLFSSSLLAQVDAEFEGIPEAEFPAAAAPYATLIRVELPIRGNVDTDIRLKLDQVLGNVRGEQRPAVVLEFFPPPDGKGDGSEFGRCLDLARFLSSQRLSGLRTVAYLPSTIRGHAVLVAIACEQIVMHPDAKIGAAGIAERNIDPTVRRGYTEIADRRRTIPSAVALGMLDSQLHVQRITTAVGTRYVLSDEVEAIQRNTAVQSVDTVIPANEVGLLPGDRLRLEYNFVSHLANDRRELAVALGIAPGDLQVDPSMGGSWTAIRVDLNGAITGALVDQTTRGIEDRLRQGSVNFICVVIDSPGGPLPECLRLATYLSELDPTKVRTVAYVAQEALGAASVIPLACDQMALPADGILGGAGAVQPDVEEVKRAVVTLREIMGDKSRSWSLPASLLDSDLEVVRYRPAGSAVDHFFCPEELRSQADPGRWQKVDAVSPPGELLQVDGLRAKELGLAHHLADDFSEFRQRYQLDNSPELIEPNWANELIAALATPQVSAALLFIAGFAMIAEVSAPGIGIGGFISALCFLLFFWSNFLMGTAGWLEAVLFLGGIVFVAMEILVLPGFGIFGLGGGLMIITSLVLASQTFVIPQNAYQMEQFPRSLFTVVAAFAGVITSAVLLRKYLEKTPFLRHVMLRPPTGKEQERREAVVNYGHLLDQLGRTTTPLSPSGKADFDGELVDVVSEGLAVDKETPVVVIEVAGNRVVVREASNS